MTARTLAWAWDLKGLDPLEKLILIDMADNADGGGNGEDNGEASVSSLVRLSNATRDDVERAIGALIYRGIIKVTYRRGDVFVFHLVGVGP